MSDLSHTILFILFMLGLVLTAVNHTQNKRKIGDWDLSASMLAPMWLFALISFVLFSGILKGILTALLK